MCAPCEGCELATVDCVVDVVFCTDTAVALVVASVRSICCVKLPVRAVQDPGRAKRYEPGS